MRHLGSILVCALLSQLNAVRAPRSSPPWAYRSAIPITFAPSRSVPMEA